MMDWEFIIVFIIGSVLYFFAQFLYKVVLPWIIKRLDSMADNLVAKILKAKGICPECGTKLENPFWCNHCGNNIFN